MKTLQRRIQQAARERRVSQLVIERDYAQSYVLAGIARTEALIQALVFKGGTALKKVYFGQYRFSEDLDFSMVGGPRDRELEDAIGAAISAAQKAARELTPLTFTVERYEGRDPHPSGQEAFVVRVEFPWQRQPVVPVKVEVTHDEPLLLPAPPRPITHGYDERLDVSVRTYSLEEIAAEKLRSTRQTHARLVARGWARSRARDYYDLWHLVRQASGRINWSQVSAVLPDKCALRQVAIAGIDDIFASAVVEEVRATWERTLGPFVTDLPKVETVFAETRAALERVLVF